MKPPRLSLLVLRSADLIRLLTPRLDSKDFCERVVTAGNLWMINRSEKALVILQQEATGGYVNDMAQDYLDEVEFTIREELPEDRKAIHGLHQHAFGTDIASWRANPSGDCGRSTSAAPPNRRIAS